MKIDRPVRILHVLGGLNIGGIETWLLHLLRSIDREQFRMDFAVHTDRPCAYDDDVQALGSKLLRCLTPGSPLAYSKAFLRLLREHGPYNVVHSHVHFYSGLVMWLSRRARVPIRIAHSHSDVREAAASASIHRKLYIVTMRSLIHANATHGLAASRSAAEDLFGLDWEADGRFRVLHCGLDLAEYRAEMVDPLTRAEFGLPADALVVGHVGRFVAQKNHSYLIRVLAEMARIDRRVHGLLVGTGHLKAEVERQVSAAGLGSKVIFAGARRDVPRLMKSAIDVFVFPSVSEGLGLAIVEAQAAGLGCVVSTKVPAEVEQSSAVWWMSLDEPPQSWAATALKVARKGRSAPPDTATWPSDIRTSLASLRDIYCSA